MRYLRRLLVHIYDSLQLNLGIKRRVERWFRQIFSSFDALFFGRIYQLIYRFLYKKIVHHYGADYRWDDERSQNLDKAMGSFGYGSVHYSLVRNQRPKRILCIGSMYGFIPYMLAKACMDNGYGHVDFVDAGYDMADSNDGGRHIYGQGFWRKKAAVDHFSYLLDPSYLTLHVMTTKEFAKKFSKRTYDYVYLDGDHRYRGAKLDFKTFWPRLNEGGYMAIHDIHFDTEAGGIVFEQWKLWEELVKKYPYKIELYNRYSGLGILQKLSQRPKRFQGPLP